MGEVNDLLLRDPPPQHDVGQVLVGHWFLGGRPRFRGASCSSTILARLATHSAKYAETRAGCLLPGTVVSSVVLAAFLRRSPAAVSYFWSTSRICSRASCCRIAICSLDATRGSFRVSLLRYLRPQPTVALALPQRRRHARPGTPSSKMSPLRMEAATQCV